MPFEITEEQNGKILDVRLTGKLVKEDYRKFVPAVERAVQQHGRIRMLVVMHDFHGETARGVVGRHEVRRESLS